ncbi:MAG: hypothetical protein EBZ69_01470 [Alphaproteobacteria bacterium]|nr:hypothetical protein [Alphaproteobacteria bacterium]
MDDFLVEKMNNFSVFLHSLQPDEHLQPMLSMLKPENAAMFAPAILYVRMKGIDHFVQEIRRHSQATDSDVMKLYRYFHMFMEIHDSLLGKQ